MSNRGQEIKISLKDRIAALGLDGRGQASSATNATSATPISLTPGSGYQSSSSGSSPLAGVRDKAARFESIGGVPVPRGSFGLGAPPAFNNPRKAGELYGNRIPSGNGRSPNGSPGRSPADEHADPEFLRVRLRRTSYVEPNTLSNEVESPTWVQVIPPTPAFAAAFAPDIHVEKTTVDEEQEPEETPEQEQVSASPIKEEPSPVETPQTPASEEVDQTATISPTSPNVAETTNLTPIPESPSTSAMPSTSRHDFARPTIASKRRSLIEPLTALPVAESRPMENPVSSPPNRTSTLSPPTSSPRRTKSQTASRASSVASNSSVFDSPPSDEGEISGGGSTSSPTLEAVNTAIFFNPEAQQYLNDSIDDEPPFSADLSSPQSLNSPNRRVLEKGRQSEEPVQDATEVDISEMPHSSIPKSATGSFSISPRSPTSPTNVNSDLIAETASPARVLRELKQLGMEKQTSIVIVPPKRSSVLSMMLPASPTPSNALFEGERSRELSSPSKSEHRPQPLHTSVGSPSVDEDASASVTREEEVGSLLSHSIIRREVNEKKRESISEVSPTTASMISFSQSTSGTSDASFGRTSFGGSPHDSISFSTPANITLAPVGSLSRTSTSTDYLPPITNPAPRQSSIPFVSHPSESSRAESPSPPASFRSLYSSGRLPPSSRGPGPHKPSSKTPLLQRAVSLMSRALPPIPKEDLPPRKSSSAFNVIRTRTSSKSKRDKHEEERASTSSDMTITESDYHGRPRTSSSPLERRSVADHSIPPVPSLVVVDENKRAVTPIAEMYMRSSRTISNEGSRQPPSSYRSASPTPSFSSAQASISSCGPPVHLFSPSFDQGIFDAFPQVPDHFPTDSMVARHNKGERPQLGMLPSRSFSELEDHLGRSYSNNTTTNAEQDRNGTIKRKGSSGVDEFGNPAANDQALPGRRKTPSRKLIPGWDDDDEEVGEGEMGWANVSVVRRQIA